jgi:beta-N-acetylhexosaminidase
MHKKVWVVLIVWALALPVCAQSAKSVWIDSVFNTLSLPDKIGQVLMVSVDGTAEWDDIEKLGNAIRKDKIGGVIFSGGGPLTCAKVIQHLQQEVDVPLLVGMHAEQGPGAVLDSLIKFPEPLMLGTVRDDSLMYFLGEEIGKQLKSLGVHLNFGPTTDLSTSFQNTELVLHSYGDNKERVAQKFVAYQRGLNKSNIFSIANYYPDANMRVDGFNKGVPVLKTQTNPARLYPLQIMIDHGLAGVVTALEHEPVSATNKRVFADKKKVLSKTLPTLYSGEYIKRQVNLKGLVFTFIPNVESLGNDFDAGDAEVFALQAGNDVLLFPENVNAAIRKLRRAIRRDNKLEEQLDASVKKILAIKFDAGLTTKPVLDTQNLHARLNSVNATALQSILLEKSVVVVNDSPAMLPIQQLDRSFASLSIGDSVGNTFNTYLSNYVGVAPYTFPADTAGLLATLSKYDVVIAAIYPTAQKFESQYPTLLQQLATQTKLITVVFDSPTKLSSIETVPTLVLAHTADEAMQKIVPQLLFGGKRIDGMMPVTITQSIKQGQGIETSSIKRITYSIPELAGINTQLLSQIDSIAMQGIRQQAMPGCQIIVARKGKIVYEKSFGWQTYDKKIPITRESIYDLASLTKVTATLQVSMFLYEKGLIDIYKKASVYLPELQNTNKKDMVVKDILTHQAGLIPFIPFWIQTVKDSALLPQYYSRVKSEQYPLQVAPTVFGLKTLPDSLWSWSIKSKLREKAARTPYNYTYSDIGLYIMHHINEKLINQPQQDFLNQNLFEPLGATTTGYLPLERFTATRIVPSERDKIFRRETLLGTVHDEGAAMLGGVAGHAGVFSTASDLLKVGQMLLQKGYYGGQQYYKPETVDYFTTKQFDTSRRGLGWDKPVQSEWNSPASILSSPKTFGHTGFTGTCMWIDPEFDLVYIFLSNRVYPSRNNNKLSSLNIRSRIQDVIYRAVFDYEQYGNAQFDSKLIPYINQISN